jgi:hypothetical protein
MTRKEIEENYEVDKDGVIQSLGKFEAEMVYVPYYWEAYLNGMQDRDDGKVLGFDVTAEDKEMFPELKGRRTVKLVQGDNGFVCEVR